MIFVMMAMCACAQSSRPVMVFDRLTHNFGDVPRKGGDLIKEFRFVNKGDAPLLIKKITKSCSCMTVTYSRKPVMPGEESEVKVVVETMFRPSSSALATKEL